MIRHARSNFRNCLYARHPRHPRHVLLALSAGPSVLDCLASLALLMTCWTYLHARAFSCDLCASGPKSIKRKHRSNYAQIRFCQLPMVSGPKACLNSDGPFVALSRLVSSLCLILSLPLHPLFCHEVYLYSALHRYLALHCACCSDRGATVCSC